MTEKELRVKIINCYKTLEVRGLGQGTSGNVSVRNDDVMLITPSAVPLRKENGNERPHLHRLVDKARDGTAIR